MKNEFIGSTICTAAASTATALQPNVVWQYIQMAITIIAGIISIALGLRAWWKEAKKDGKITKEEVKDAIDIVTSGGKNIKDTIEQSEESKDSEKGEK